jgi:hypothetical protein
MVLRPLLYPRSHSQEYVIKDTTRKCGLVITSPVKLWSFVVSKLRKTNILRNNHLSRYNAENRYEKILLLTRHYGPNYNLSVLIYADLEIARSHTSRFSSHAIIPLQLDYPGERATNLYDIIELPYLVIWPCRHGEPMNPESPPGMRHYCRRPGSLRRACRVETHKLKAFAQHFHHCCGCAEMHSLSPFPSLVPSNHQAARQVAFFFNRAEMTGSRHDRAEKEFMSTSFFQEAVGLFSLVSSLARLLYNSASTWKVELF